MRNDEICVFLSEVDCPKDSIHMTCEECEKNKFYEVIEKALNDFVSLGDSFTELFTLCNDLIKHNGTTVEVQIPTDSIHSVNRVMNALLSTVVSTSPQDIIYRRLIYHFFNIIIDEFKEEEYIEEDRLH